MPLSPTASSKTVTKGHSWLRFALLTAFMLALMLATAWLVYRDDTTPPNFSSDDFAALTLAQSVQKIADATVAGGATGTLILVRKNGQEIAATAGIADKLTGEKMPLDEALRIGSVSKVYLAAVILTLADQGLVDLDANITKYLRPEILDGVANAEFATVRQLLLHTSGIPDYYDIRSYFSQDWRQAITLARVLPVSKRRDANFDAGERFEYSNMGYIFLGEIAQSVSGKSLASLIDDIINTPLQFQNTHYNVKHPDANVIHGYGTIMRPWADTYDLWEHSGPDGGIMASASETLRLLEALTLDNGSLKQIGELMLADTIPSGRRQQQGLGLTTIASKDGPVLVGHTGDVFGYQTIAFAHPESQAVFIGHVNCDCSKLSNSLIKNIYKAVKYSVKN